MKRDEKLQAYLAAPLFNEIERTFNLKITDALSEYLNIFLPQRDGGLLKDLVAEGISPDQAREMVYRQDIEAIHNSDILIAVLDGRTIDDGVAFELGYARALDKVCLGLKTDDRALLRTGDNPMIVFGCNKVFSTFEELFCVVQSANNSVDGMRQALINKR